MASIKFSFLSAIGLLPKTEEIEAKQAALEKEYQEFVDFENSEELKKYLQLETFVLSAEFADAKKKIENLNFKTTDQFTKEAEYLKLTASKRIKTYYSTKNSSVLAWFNQFSDSPVKARYDELNQLIHSDAFIAAKKEMEQNI